MPLTVRIFFPTTKMTKTIVISKPKIAKPPRSFMVDANGDKEKRVNKPRTTSKRQEVKVKLTPPDLAKLEEAIFRHGNQRRQVFMDKLKSIPVKPGQSGQKRFEEALQFFWEANWRPSKSGKRVMEVGHNK